MKQIHIRGLMAVMTATLLFTGCSQPSTSTQSGDSPGTPAKKDPFELVIYYPYAIDWPEEEFNKTFGSAIQKKFPHITVKYINTGTIPDLIASGQKLDIIITSIGTILTQMLDAKLTVDLTPQIKKYNFDLSRLDPAMVDAARKVADGGIYGLPVYVPPSALYYNKDVFDKFGVPYPKDGMTWDDLYELSKKLTRDEGSQQYFGLATSYSHLAMLNSRSIPLVNNDSKKATFDTDERWQGFVENLVRFYRLPGFEVFKTGQLSEPFERNRFFKDRNIAMFLSTTTLHNETEIGDMNWDLASFPVFKDSPAAGPQSLPGYFYVTSLSDHRDEAFEVAAYMTSDEFQTQRIKEGKFLSALANKSIRQQFGQEHPLYKGKNVKALQPDKYSPTAYSRYNGIASGELNTAIKDMIVNKKDVNTILREAAEKANKKIQDAEAAAGGKK